MPQKNTAPNKELKKIYQEIKDQMEQARQQCQNITTLVDINAKMGARIKGEKKREKVVKLVDKQDMVILND